MALKDHLDYFGGHAPIPTGNNQFNTINAFEAQIDARQSIVVTFRKWGTPQVSDFASAGARLSMNQSTTMGRILMLTWEPWADGGVVGAFTLESIAAGDHDAYITASAEALKALDRPVCIRFGHEMNGDWYPWCGRPTPFINAWRRIHGIFQTVGTPRVKWIWCVNVSDTASGGAMENYWPGSAYVDVLGIDGYNGYSGGWRQFKDIFLSMYGRITALHATYPVWICETATGEVSDGTLTGTAGRSKPEWIQQMFAATGLERIKAVCWFDQDNPSSFDWRIATTEASRAALATQVRGSTAWRSVPGAACSADGHTPCFY